MIGFTTARSMERDSHERVIGGILCDEFDRETASESATC